MSTTDEREIREVFERWASASAARDLDASMQPIASSIVSYEHSSPLQFTDIDLIREECRAGFERQASEFEWTVPDLEVIVRGDIAVTWGLNKMTDVEPNGVSSTIWSRGTRVFQRIDGRWQMIHQHVSFPTDPATGMAAVELQP
jgi:ketosteroid isomerase-like protein